MIAVTALLARGFHVAYWWRRTYAGEYLRPVSRDAPDLQCYLRPFGWEAAER